MEYHPKRVFQEFFANLFVDKIMFNTKKAIDIFAILLCLRKLGATVTIHALKLLIPTRLHSKLSSSNAHDFFLAHELLEVAKRNSHLKQHCSETLENLSKRFLREVDLSQQEVEQMFVEQKSLLESEKAQKEKEETPESSTLSPKTSYMYVEASPARTSTSQSEVPASKKPRLDVKCCAGSIHELLGFDKIVTITERLITRGSMKKEQLRLVNRERAAMDTLSALADQKLAGSLSETPVVALSQPFGIGKTTFVQNLHRIATETGIWSELLLDYDNELVQDLKQSLLLSIDLRGLHITQEISWDKALFHRCNLQWKAALRVWLEDKSIESVHHHLRELDAKISAGDLCFFEALQQTQVPMIVHLDEIDAVNGEPQVQVPSMSNRDVDQRDFARVRSLWSYASLCLAKPSKTFLILTGRLPHLFAMMKRLCHVELSSVSPTDVRPIFLNCLSTTHIQKTFETTKLNKAPTITLMDVMRYLGLPSQLDTEFFEQVLKFTAGIPRPVSYLADALMKAPPMHLLQTEEEIEASMTQCLVHIKVVDLCLIFKEELRELGNRVLVLGAMNVQIPTNMNITINGKSFPFLFVVNALNFMYEVDIERNSFTIKVPYYSLMQGMTEIRKYSLMWSKALLRQPAFLSKDVVFQEMVLQLTVLKLTLNKGKQVKEIFPAYADCFFADERIDIPLAEDAILLYPAFYEKSKKKGKKEAASYHSRYKKRKSTERVNRDNSDDIAKQPWHYKLQRSFTCFKSLLEYSILKQGYFGRPVPCSVGGDATFVLKYDAKSKELDIVEFQYKIHSNKDVTWSIIQQEIDKVSLILPSHSAEWKVRVCLSMIVLGLGSEVDTALEHSNGVRVLKTGEYAYNPQTGLIQSNEKQVLKVPHGMELVLMTEQQIQENFVGGKNMGILNDLNNWTSKACALPTSVVEILLS